MTCADKCDLYTWGDRATNSCVSVCSPELYNLQTRTCETAQTSTDTVGPLDFSVYALRGDAAGLTLNLNRRISLDRADLRVQTQEDYVNECLSLQLVGASVTVSYRFRVNALDQLQTALFFEGSQGVANPKVVLRVSSPTCLVDTNGVPVLQDFARNGRLVQLPYSLINYDAATVQAAATTQAVSQAMADTTSTMAFPLTLTNVMFIFWLMINVFQIINLFAYLNVQYPINLISFFRAFKR